MSDELINIHPNSPPVSGYRDLTRAEVDVINTIKATGAAVGDLVTAIRGIEGIDQRWVAIGATELQQGFMALVRAVAQPTGF